MSRIINAYLVKRIEKLEQENEFLKKDTVNYVPTAMVEFVKAYVIEKIYYDRQKDGVYVETYWGERHFFEGRFIRDYDLLKHYLPKWYEK